MTFHQNVGGITPVDAAFAGATSGLVTRLITQPLDVVKVRFQLQVEPIDSRSAHSKYKSTWQALRIIFKEERIRGLWKGHNPGQLLSLSYGTVQFFIYETLSHGDWFSHHRSLIWNFVNGSFAGAFATVVSLPFDVIKTRFIAQGNTMVYKNMMDASKQMYNTEGWRSFYRGLVPTTILVMPQAGAQFMFYGLISRIFKKLSFLSRANKELNVTGDFIAGSISGALAKTVIYPLDLIRKRLQFQGFQKARTGFGKNFYCVGLISCLHQTYKEEGPLSLFKGLSPSLVKAALTTAMYFTFYNQLCILIANIKNA